MSVRWPLFFLIEQRLEAEPVSFPSLSPAEVRPSGRPINTAREPPLTQASGMSRALAQETGVASFI